MWDRAWTWKEVKDQQGHLRDVMKFTANMVLTEAIYEQPREEEAPGKLG